MKKWPECDSAQLTNSRKYSAKEEHFMNEVMHFFTIERKRFSSDQELAKLSPVVTSNLTLLFCWVYNLLSSICVAQFVMSCWSRSNEMDMFRKRTRPLQSSEAWMLNYRGLIRSNPTWFWLIRTWRKSGHSLKFLVYIVYYGSAMSVLSNEYAEWSDFGSCLKLS